MIGTACQDSRSRTACTALDVARTAKRLGDEPFFSKPINLLNKVRAIEFVTPSRPDECCGFGGGSAKMGYDKVADHHGAGAEYIVSADMSCLMHQKGCAARVGLKIRFIHIAQILNGDHAFIAAKAQPGIPRPAAPGPRAQT